MGVHSSWQPVASTANCLRSSFEGYPQKTLEHSSLTRPHTRPGCLASKPGKDVATQFGLLFRWDWDVHWGYDLGFDPWPCLRKLWLKTLRKLQRRVAKHSGGGGSVFLWGISSLPILHQSGFFWASVFIWFPLKAVPENDMFRNGGTPWASALMRISPEEQTRPPPHAHRHEPIFRKPKGSKQSDWAEVPATGSRPWSFCEAEWAFRARSGFGCVFGGGIRLCRPVFSI